MKICFVAPNVYPFFYHQSSQKRIGGAELQQKLIGEALANRGVDVSYISKDVGQSKIERVGNIVFYRIFSDTEGIPGIRFFYPRLFKIFKALKIVDADIYYVRCAGFLAGITAFFCKFNKKKFVFASAHDTDFIPGKEMIPLSRDRWLYRKGFPKADLIISQTESQNQLLTENYGLNGIVIRNFYNRYLVKQTHSDKKLILWVATIKQWKQPLVVIDLARLFPNQKFVMIGGRSKGNERLYTEIQECSANMNNFSFLGFQEIGEVEKIFSECKVFINTSKYEGFPNTFLQAWSRGIPVLSLLDPDNVISRYGLGEVAENEDDLQYKLIKLLENEGAYKKNISTYFENEHSTKLIEKYLDVFQGVLGSENQ